MAKLIKGVMNVSSFKHTESLCVIIFRQLPIDKQNNHSTVHLSFSGIKYVFSHYKDIFISFPTFTNPRTDQGIGLYSRLNYIFLTWHTVERS